MTDNINRLIDDFSPKPISIPIDRCELEKIIETIYSSMFPVCDNGKLTKIKSKLKESIELLHKNIVRLHDKEKADSIIEQFTKNLPAIQERLYEDAHCYFKSDPAAKSVEEIILTYPGFFALSIYRIAHLFNQLGLTLIARFFSEYAHSKAGIDIHPGAKIGDNLFMDHGIGIVIGETTIIGDDVKIYQGVTLGALYVEKKLSNVKRHPTVEDNVVIYANATILGGDTTIGHDSVIGGGAWVTESIIPYSLVYNTVDVKVRTVKDFQEPHNFII